MNTREIYILVTLILAVFLDFLLIWWWRRAKSSKRGISQKHNLVRKLLFADSPTLSWVRRVARSFKRSSSDASSEKDPGSVLVSKTRVRAEARFSLLRGQSVQVVINTQTPMPATLELQGGNRSNIVGSDSSPKESSLILETEDEVRKFALAQFWDYISNSEFYRRALPVLSIFLAVIPAYVVIYEYWFVHPIRSEFLDRVWYQSGLSRHFAYPANILVIVAATIFLFLTFRSNRVHLGTVFSSQDQPVRSAEHILPTLASKRFGKVLILGALLLSGVGFLAQLNTGEANGWYFLPSLLLYVAGWMLWGADLDAIKTRLLVNWEPILAFLFFHISLVGLLSEYYGLQESVVLWALLFLLSILFLVRYIRRIEPVYWISTLALLLYTFRINGWEFSVIGDDYSFYMYARELVAKYDIIDVIGNLFDGTRVYNSHPFFSSAIHMLSMTLFRDNNFGWRFSNPYLCSLSLPFFYYFYRRFFRARLALLSVIFLAASHYLMTFGKIGYNNLQALFMMSLALASGGWALQVKRSHAFAIFGLSLGACFYVFPAALFVIVLGYLLLWFYHRPLTRESLSHWGIVLGSMLFLVVPLFLHKDYWLSKISGTFLYVPELTSNGGALLENIYTNLFYSFYSFLLLPQESHFVVISHVDAITGVLYLIGLAYILANWRVNRFFGYFLAGLILLITLVGVSHGTRFPLNTRMFLLLPWYAMGAAIGMIWLQNVAKEFTLSNTILNRATALILVALFALNLYQAYSVSKMRSTGLQSASMLFARLVEHVRGQKEMSVQPVRFTFLTTSEHGIDGYALLLDAYDVQESLIQLDKIEIEYPALTADVRNMILETNRFVIINPYIDEELQSELSAALKGLGKQLCNVRTLTGDVRFELWYSPSMEWICDFENR